MKEKVRDGCWSKLEEEGGGVPLWGGGGGCHAQHHNHGNTTIIPTTTIATLQPWQPYNHNHDNPPCLLCTAEEELELAMRSGKVRRLHPIPLNQDGTFTAQPHPLTMKPRPFLNSRV